MVNARSCVRMALITVGLNDMKISANFGLVLLTVFLAIPAQAEFTKRVYVGLGGGVSFMSPNENDTGYVLDQDSDTAAKAYLGWDFAKKWAVEGHVATLGDATFVQGPGESLTPPEGAIAYQAVGLSALYHLYNSQGDLGYEDRTGFAVFAKLGVGMLDTESDDLEVEQLEDAHLLLGLGLEYEFESGLALRAEYEAFDEDAQMATVGLLWRFGGGHDASAVSTVPVASSSPDTDSTSSESDAITDTDLDGVPDLLDACPSTTAGRPVDNRGCPEADQVQFGVLEGVTFESASATLTADAQSILDETASQLLRSPEIRIAIMAHTDNQGSAAGNLELSKQRALSVARYLVSRGVAATRIRPEAYGESRPIVSNGTREGRAINRRVELRRLN